MRIAYVHTAYWPSDSPSITFSSLAAYSLAGAAEGCDFFIKRNSTLSPKQVYAEYFGLKKPVTLKVHDIEPLLDFSNIFYYLRVYSMLKSRIRQGLLDCIITRNITFIPYLVRLRKKYGTPVFFESHDFYSGTKRKRKRSKKSEKYARIEKKYFSGLSGLICLQQAQADLYRQEYPDIEIIIAGTGLQEIKKPERDNRRYITYIGSLDEHKGVRMFLKVLDKIRPGTEIVIIGAKSDEQVKTLKEVTKNPGVNILPWLKHRELETYLEQTKIGVLPLEPTFFNRYLTSPLKLFDYFAYGIPVIASDMPSLRSLIKEGKTGLFYDHSEEDLAVKINMLLDDSEKWRSMSENVYRFASERLWIKRGEFLAAEIRQRFF